MNIQEIKKKLTNLMFQFKQLFRSSKTNKEACAKNYCIFVVPKGSTNPDKDRIHFMIKGDHLSDEEISQRISMSEPF